MVFFSLPINEGGALLGVQFDDQVFCDLKVDIVSSRQSADLPLQVVGIAVQPLGSSDKRIILFHLLEAIVGAALFAHGNHVTDLDHVRRDVDPLAIDGVVAMVHQLARFTTGRSKAQTINDIVQTTLDQAQQDLTGVRSSALHIRIS